MMKFRSTVFDCCVIAKINSLCLENFLTMMEQGYSKHGNPYHNLIHAADVTQTTHAIITDSGLNVSCCEIVVIFVT